MFDYIATRTFSQNGGSEIVLKIGAPYPVGNGVEACKCDYVLEVGEKLIKRSVEGVDSIQALLLALAASEQWLTDSEISDVGPVKWEGGSAGTDLGLQSINLRTE